MKKAGSVWKKILRLIVILLGVLILLAAGFVGYLTVREYQPEQEEALTITGESKKSIGEGESLSLLTFNIGYGALDKNHDFFMDGGKDVTIESAEMVKQNMEGIKNIIQKENTDVVFLQEVDIDSKRSYHINQAQIFEDLRKDDVHSFATNFKCDYIPYPGGDMIGKVNGGIQSLNKMKAEEAVRIALPTSFQWPLRIGQLKRCLLVERVAVKDSDKELVLVNLHLEAYDDGSGKEAQTSVLAKLLKEEYGKGNYVIAGGDFNSTFSNVDKDRYPLYEDEYFKPGDIDINLLGEGWTFAADDTWPTSRLLNGPYDPSDSKTQYFVIDGFILSPNVRLDLVTTLDQGFAYSDHNPVRLQATLNIQNK